MAAVTVTDLAPGAGTKPLGGVPKRGLRGAMFGLPYVGPARINSTSHAPGQDGGGAVTTNGYRESDSYVQSGGEVEDAGLSAAEGADAIAVTRPSRTRWSGTNAAVTPTAYIAKGVPGGSLPGAPIDDAGRAIDTGTDRFGRTLGTPNSGGGIRGYTYTNFDGRTTRAGSGGRALGNGDAGTMASTGETVTFETKAQAPTIGAAANPAAGTIGLVNGTGGVMQVDLHADDITGGASGLKGFEVLVMSRGGVDTDEDNRVLKYATVDGGTDISTLFTPTAGTYALYARKRYANTDGSIAVGQWSERATLAVT